MNAQPGHWAAAAVAVTIEIGAFVIWRLMRRRSRTLLQS
jgi:hypothetical protein